MRRDSREDGMVGLRGTVQIGHHGTLLLRSLPARLVGCHGNALGNCECDKMVQCDSL